MSDKLRTISLIIPVLNEEDNVSGFIAEMTKRLSNVHDYHFEYIFVDDGSTDSTLKRLSELAISGIPLKIIELSRNFGKEAALSAGIDHAIGDAVIPIDVDLQDPPHVIVDLIAKWEDGWEVVLAVRSDRSSDTFAKSYSARLFYWLHNRFSSPRIPANCGDFRLMDKVVAAALRKLPENQRFMKGLLLGLISHNFCELCTRTPFCRAVKIQFWSASGFCHSRLYQFQSCPPSAVARSWAHGVSNGISVCRIHCCAGALWYRCAGLCLSDGGRSVPWRNAIDWYWCPW